MRPGLPNVLQPYVVLTSATPSTMSPMFEAPSEEHFMAVSILRQHVANAAGLHNME